MNFEASIGQKIQLTLNKRGTLRYYGPVEFAPDIWCGVELDQPDGDNDGSVNSVRYFSCKENHGVFCRVSELLSGLEKEPSNSSPDQLPVDLNGFCKELSKNAVEEALKSKELHILFKNFEDLSDIVDKDLSGSDKDLPFSLENFDDSNESLGILPFLLNEDEKFNENCAESFIYPYEEIDCQQVFNNMNIEHSILSAENSLLEQHCNLNATQNIYSSQQKIDLNTTIILQNPVIELKATQDNILIDEEFPSPIWFRPKSSHSKSEASPIHKIASTPKHCSTPKHDPDSTFVMYEEYLNSEEKFDPVDDLNAMDDKDVLKENIRLAESNELDVNELSRKIALLSPNTEETVLNTTCNIVTESITHKQQQELNETFNKDFIQEKFRPVTDLNAMEDKDVLKVNIGLAESNELDVNELSRKIALLSSNTEETVLNTTCNIVTGSITHEQQQELNKTFNKDFIQEKFHPVTDLNAMNDKDVLKENIGLAESNELDVNELSRKIALFSSNTEETVLNTTCNIVTGSITHDQQQELNKTFNNDFINNKFLPIIPTIDFSTELENRADDLKDSSEKNSCGENEISSKDCEASALNTTISLPEKYATLNIDPNKIQAFGQTSENAYNISKTHDKTIDEEMQSIHDETHILNTTYEKVDKLFPLPKIGHSKVQDKKTGNIKTSKIAKRISDVASSCKIKELNVKNRKSICDFGEKNSKITYTSNRRQTFGSVSSKDDITPKSYCIQQKNPNSQTISDSSQLKIHSISSGSCKKSDNIDTEIDTGFKSLKSKSKSLKYNEEFSEIPIDQSLAAKIFSEKPETLSSDKNQLKLEQLEETVIITKTTFNAEKTDIKRLAVPPKKIPVKCEIPKLMQPTTVTRKSSLPISRDYQRSSIEAQKKKTTLSRQSMRAVLSQKNSSGQRNVPDSTSTDRCQILDTKAKMTGAIPKAVSRIETNLKKLESFRSSQSRKKDKDAPVKYIATRSASIQSKIPEVKSKKKEDTGISPSEKQIGSPSRRSLR